MMKVFDSIRRVPRSVWLAAIVLEVSIAAGVLCWRYLDQLNNLAGLAGWFSGFGAFAAAAVAVGLAIRAERVADQRERQRQAEKDADARSRQRVLAYSLLPAVADVATVVRMRMMKIPNLIRIAKRERGLQVYRADLAVPVPELLQLLAPELHILGPEAGGAAGMLHSLIITFDAMVKRFIYGSGTILGPENLQFIHGELEQISQLCLLLSRRLNEFLPSPEEQARIGAILQHQRTDEEG